MSGSIRTTVVRHDPGDGSGDGIIALSMDVLKAMKVGLGESLSIALVDGSVALKPIREVDPKA
ncbi:AbrB/MazE/SpoVT family DNA-binding domain-containing protein [Pseudomonas sp. MWU16-30317]|uniref:AbrB/MazE/SpoVT family DNA-binding domain-containing protein n=1 Tax=Pseudomonas sp. MWU16-30317 TaxID=2878095 RepID=UPI001CFA4367|nr:AbrB/MazE/SpoVT family DNA-binding domain-containing protein [Pseudomonas sp. MWU16-30317]